MKKTFSIALWSAIALVGAFSLSVLALHRGETINSLWLITVALAFYIIAFRFYSSFIATNILELDDERLTPAQIKNDGKDFVPTNKWVLFGHHFAAIAGAGPLVGPILAAQMGYLPSTLWIILGVVIAGAVQDFIILILSIRREGKTLGEMVKDEIGETVGFVAKIGILGIMIIIIAVLGLVVVKALVGSPWGLFTIAMTIPIALLMGVYMRYIRPGAVVEASIFGFVLLISSIFMGQQVAASPFWGEIFNCKATTIAILMIIYGFIASVLPVWLLLAPRDYLSTFLKIGVIAGLALGIIIVQPDLLMPSITRFIDGSGPVLAGNLFPFLFVTIACGAISGFHSLIASGTTPKMIATESHARTIGYGAMLVESFVAIMALIAACVLHPGVYFAINSPVAVIGTELQAVATTVSSWGDVFVISPEELAQWAKDVGETSITSRTGGAPTLAIGMSYILQQIIGGKAAMAFWYHFAILFEALFILTTVDAGTRVGRFMIQEIASYVYKPLGSTKSLYGNIIGTSLCVAGWGYFIYQGVIDPLGGINTLWPLFGIANQMLAGIALILATTVVLKMGKRKYLWVVLVPTIFVLTTTTTAGLEKVFHSSPKIGFFAHAELFAKSKDTNQLLAPAKNITEMDRIITNDYVNISLTLIFISVVIIIFASAIFMWIKIYRGQNIPLKEGPYIRKTASNYLKV